MLLLVFTFQAFKSCSQKFKFLQVEKLRTYKCSSFLSVRFSFRVFFCKCKTETIWRRSVAQHTGDGGSGGRAREEDEVEGELGSKV